MALGLVGAAVAYVVEEGIMVVMCFIIMSWTHCHQTADNKTWTGFSKEACKGWGPYLQVGQMDDSLGINLHEAMKCVHV